MTNIKSVGEASVGHSVFLVPKHSSSRYVNTNEREEGRNEEGRKGRRRKGKEGKDEGEKGEGGKKKGEKRKEEGRKEVTMKNPNERDHFVFVFTEQEPRPKVSWTRFYSNKVL